MLLSFSGCNVCLRQRAFRALWIIIIRGMGWLLSHKGSPSAGARRAFGRGELRGSPWLQIQPGGRHCAPSGAVCSEEHVWKENCLGSIRRLANVVCCFKVSIPGIGGLKDCMHPMNYCRMMGDAPCTDFSLVQPMI